MVQNARSLLAVLSLGCFTLGCAAQPAPPPVTAGAPERLSVPTQIVTGTEATSERELMARAESAIAAGRYADAARDLELLLAAQPSVALVPRALFQLAVAYEALGEREKARTRFRELAARFPKDPFARIALGRAIELHAYLEEWPALGEAGNALLARPDTTALDRMLGLGARGLSRIEAGDVPGASHDVLEGLDLVEENRLGDGGRLPLAAAQLRFALGEVRRVKAERITFEPSAADFGARLEARCTLLLDAQSSYADAMHAIDPHWAAVSGYRVGEMYRLLHREVMALPAPGPVKTEHDRQVFYAAMHLRYRVLLEKALKLMDGTLEVTEKTKDGSAWVARARASKADIETALAQEKATLATFPFSEAEMQRGLELLLKKHEAEGSAKGLKK